MNGFFLGGLLDGAAKGIKIGNAIKEANKEYQANDLREKGMEEARQARELEINGAITSNGVAPTAQSNQAASVSADTAPGVNDAPTTTTAVQQPVAPSATPIAVASPAGQVTSTPLPDQGQPQPSAPAATLPQQQSIAAANGIPTYTVGGKAYTDPTQARAAAAKNASSVNDLFVKNTASKMKDFYIQNGDLETADKWDKWATDSKNKAGMKLWAGAYTDAQSGNWDGAADKFGKYYSGHIDDGVDYVGHKQVVGDDGKLIGFAVTLKDQKTGKQTDMQLTPQAMLKMGMANNPQMLFDSEMKKQATVDATKAKIAEENVKQQGRIQLEGVKAGTAEKLQGNRDDAAMERIVTKSQMDASNAADKIRTELSTKMDALKQSGMSDEDIKAQVPALIIGQAYKKGASPEEAARMAYQDRMKNDQSFSRKTEEQRQAIIEGDVRIAKTAALIGAKRPQAGSIPAPAAPAASGVTGAATSAAGKIPVYDTKTGRMVYR